MTKINLFLSKAISVLSSSTKTLITVGKWTNSANTKVYNCNYIALMFSVSTMMMVGLTLRNECLAYCY